MKRNIIYYIDEAEVDLRTNTDSLNDLFAGTEIIIHSQLPFRNLADYNPLVAAADTAAFILDQRMKGSGLVNYSGTDLASHLRTINSKLPIYILTGYADQREEFSGAAHRVEYIIAKRDIANSTSESAQTVKARMLRRMETFSDLLDIREQRFHDLLVKSLREKLTPDEEKELGVLEVERAVPQQAKEICDIKTLETAIAELRKRL